MSTPEGAPPPSPTFLIMTLGRKLREQVERDLRASGLSLRHLSALGHLSREPGLSYSELARRAGITAQSMQATLNQLETLGAVERTTEAGRGRTARLQVTDRGEDLRTAAQATITAADEKLLATIPEEDRAPLTRALVAAFRSPLPE